METERILAELKYRMDLIECAFVHGVITQHQRLTSLSGELRNADEGLVRILGRRLIHPPQESPLVKT